MVVILFLVYLVYFIVIGVLIYGFTKVNTIDFIGLKPKTKFTIIVPFRNEAENLPALINSFSKLNYPTDLFEIILVDDESEEKYNVGNTTYQVHIINNKRISNSPKKDAITTAMDFVKTDWVITTDADCVVPKNWLLTLDNYIQVNNVAMIAGAVTYSCNHSFLQHFQQLDLASLQGATIGSFGVNKGFMCNGANLAYTKTLFSTLNGFNGNEQIASGDDVFLLQKAIAQFPEKVHYLKSKETIVTTKPLNDWKSLFYQRVRWASKTSSYQSNFGKFLGLVVFTGNLVLVMCFGLYFAGFVSYKSLLFLFVTKLIIDSILLYQTNDFLTKRRIRYLLLSSFFYPFFSVSVALYSLLGKYEWKGRRF